MNQTDDYEEDKQLNIFALEAKYKNETLEQKINRYIKNIEKDVQTCNDNTIVHTFNTLGFINKETNKKNISQDKSNELEDKIRHLTFDFVSNCKCKTR
jgi:hypothetical protein